ncbi:symmetrical bis(5'-nucleosyl)-tetraphosphatase [Pseudoalteromonas lipolytica]|uniref:symmetrical bis(5'-nucleosyl)-tetraphosphatase n=1 Tax=Pseudoalteromonas lipolytica TaxID=570156 RepID=UPI003A9845A4
MADYAIGDLQGCYSEFDALLKRVNFNPSKDHLYLVGDIVARGPDSLGCLERLYAMQGSVSITLGNHDLHMIACYHLNKPHNPKDKLSAVFSSSKLTDYIQFLQQQPLALWLEKYDIFISHAGLNPNWSIKKALKRARFAKNCYQGADARHFFSHMYDTHPPKWQSTLSNEAKFRYIVNYFTRMRFVDKEAHLDLTNKTSTSANSSTIPWFEHPNITQLTQQIVFGHWAAIEGKTQRANIHGLDTGCVWGGEMTLMELSKKERFVESSHSFI